jgi:hypothetical protein
MTTTITLNGADYVVQPGGYRRESDGPPASRPQRVVHSDFYGGQRRAIRLEDDRGWDAVGAGPALGGQGVEPWPNIATWTDTGVAAFASTTRAPHVVVDPYGFVANGRYLYRTVARGTTAWANLTTLVDLGAGKTITGLAQYQGKIAICQGTAADVTVVAASATAPATPTTLATGVKARIAVGYANRLVYADPTAGSEHVLRMTTATGTDSRDLDAPIVAMGLHGGKVAVLTRQSLWLLGGRPDATTNKWNADPEPSFSHGVGIENEDGVFLLSFSGRLYTWIANRVVEWNPSGDRQGWRATGLEGRSCYGATVAAGWLIVTLLNLAGESEVWAYDGAGWWLAARSTSIVRIWPMATGGGGNIDLVTFRNGSATVLNDIVRLVSRGSTATSYYTGTAEYRTALLDGGSRDALKTWRRIGAVFAAPEIRGNSASVDSVGINLAWSSNGGASWTTAASATLADPTVRIVDLEAALNSAAVTGRFLQVRVTWTSVTDWAPALVALWAEYEALDPPSQRRRWRLRVRARDGVVGATGAVDPRAGEQIAADLWAAWASATVVSFTDLDGVARSVRIAEIAEEVTHPGDALVDLVLREV